MEVHDSTKETPFTLLYGWDARVPTQSTLDYQKSPYLVDTDDYIIELKDTLAEAWRVARENVSKSQTK